MSSRHVARAVQRWANALRDEVNQAPDADLRDALLASLDTLATSMAVCINEEVHEAQTRYDAAEAHFGVMERLAEHRPLGPEGKQRLNDADEAARAAWARVEQLRGEGEEHGN